MIDFQANEMWQSLPVSEQAAAQMKRYGITRIPAEYFEYGGYRYTNLADAVAQAERSEALARS